PGSTDHPLDNWQRYKNLIDFPDHAKKSLNDFLKERKATKLKRGRRKKMAKKGKGEPQSTSPKVQRKSPPERDSPSPTKTMGSPMRKKARDTPTAELLDEYEQKKLEVAELEEQIQSRLVLEGGAASSLASGATSSQTSNNSIAMPRETTLLYIHQARVGRLDMSKSPALLALVKDSLLPLPASIDNDKSEATRLRSNYDVVTTGSSQSWVQRTHDVKIRNRKKKTQEAVDSLGEDVEISVITGDSGGGAAVQRLHRALIENGTMGEDSLKLACIMHGLNKSLEIACIDAIGKPGIGHRTAWQMLYLFPLLLKNVRKQFGPKNLDSMWAMTINKLQNDAAWQNEASAKCKQPFEEFMAKLRKLEDTDLDAMVKLTSEAPKNVQDPILSRWGTVVATTETFVDNYVLIYFFAIAVKQNTTSTKSTKYLHKLACSLISLMSNRAVPTIEGESRDDFIASFNTSPDPDAPSDESFLKPGDSPRCENFVQLAGLIASTCVGEARRTCRAIVIAAIIRRFNQWGLFQRNAELKSANKPAVKRLQGSPKTRLFLQYLDSFLAKADEAKCELGEEVWKEVFERLSKTDKKASEAERTEALHQFERDLAKSRKVLAAEQPTGIDKTARVGGGIILRILTKTNGFVDHVHAEMSARSISMSESQKKSWSLAEKRGKIRQHEFNILCNKDPDYSRENNVKDIRFIKPLSDKLKSQETFDKQQAILDKEAGILALEEDNE
ncbi:hypothetical protein ACHAWF_013218, partial [Thalassiosira exigua]